MRGNGVCGVGSAAPPCTSAGGWLVHEKWWLLEEQSSAAFPLAAPPLLRGVWGSNTCSCGLLRHHPPSGLLVPVASANPVLELWVCSWSPGVLPFSWICCFWGLTLDLGIWRRKSFPAQSEERWGPTTGGSWSPECAFCLPT